MPTLPAEPLLYYANGIDAATGQYLQPPCSESDLVAAATSHLRPAAEVQACTARAGRDRPTYALPPHIAPSRLEEAGWAAVFPAGSNPALSAALQPLLRSRAAQAGPLYRLYEGEDGFLPGDTWETWCRRHGISRGAWAQPDEMPYYVLLVADPETIPLEFQYLADVHRAVGRLWFDHAEQFASYAESVVRSEAGDLSGPLAAAVFATHHPGDRATELSCEGLARPLVAALRSTLGDQDAVSAFLAQDAVKARLTGLLCRDRAPDLLIAATHGAGFRSDDERRSSCQGALVSHDWPGPGLSPLTEDMLFSAADVADTAQVAGAIVLLHACFSAGTSHGGDYVHLRARVPGMHAGMWDGAFLSPLPRRLLGHPRGGALAVVGHVDPTWSSVFSAGGRDPSGYEGVVDALVRGYRLGHALEAINARYAQACAELAMAAYETVRSAEPPDESASRRLAALWTATHESRDTIVIGDPAVRLPVPLPA